MEKINATQAARQFSDLLNRVAYQGQRFGIERSKKIVAMLEPIDTSSQGIPIQNLNEVFAMLPKLGDAAESKSFAEDVDALRRSLPPEQDPWA